jgi:hypothetical protein
MSWSMLGLTSPCLPQALASEPVARNSTFQLRYADLLAKVLGLSDPVLQAAVNSGAVEVRT